MPSWGTALRIFLCGALALALVAGGVLLQRRDEGRDLSATVAGQLAYPDSVVLVSGATEFQGVPGYLQIVGSDASMSDVFTYFDGSLARSGFVDGAGLWAMTTTREIYSCAWHGDSVVARLSFLTQQEASGRYPEVAESKRRFRTLYRWLVLDQNRDLDPMPCPDPRTVEAR